MKKLWDKYKIFISGAIVAAALAIQEFIAKGEDFSWKVVGFAAFLAAVSWLAKNLRGQAATLTGVIGTALSTYMTMEATGKVSWNQIIMQALVAAALAFFSSPPKPVEYEQTATVTGAREEAREMKQEVKDTAIKEEIKDLKKELEPDPKPLPKTDSGVN